MSNFDASSLSFSNLNHARSKIHILFQISRTRDHLIRNQNTYVHLFNLPITATMYVPTNQLNTYFLPNSNPFKVPPGLPRPPRVAAHLAISFPAHP